MERKTGAVSDTMNGVCDGFEIWVSRRSETGKMACFVQHVEEDITLFNHWYYSDYDLDMQYGLWEDCVREFTGGDEFQAWAQPLPKIKDWFNDDE
jgi:hypothetical protein